MMMMLMVMLLLMVVIAVVVAAAAVDLLLLPPPLLLMPRSSPDLYSLCQYAQASVCGLTPVTRGLSLKAVCACGQKLVAEGFSEV